MKAPLLKKLVLPLVAVAFFGSPLLAGDLYLSYIREVSNPLFLSDFQLGSQEQIKDTNGHGGALGVLFSTGPTSFWTFEMGNSQTLYQGQIEDGVEVNFAPQAGSGFEALSLSNNIVYDVNLAFSNPYVGLTYTNWDITAQSLRSNYLLPSSYGFGIIRQKVEGEVVIKGVGGEPIATAQYESGNQRYFQMGWIIGFDIVFFELSLRNVTSPILKVTSCNRAAVGETACQRIEAATGNRNNSTQLFTGGVFKAGILF